MRHFTLCFKLSGAKYSLISPSSITEEQFDDLCAKIAPKAAKNLLDKFYDEKYPIGWEEITEEIARILVDEYSFEFFLPKVKTFDGGWVITNRCKTEDDHLLGESFTELACYNDHTIWDGYSQVVS